MIYSCSGEAPQNIPAPTPVPTQTDEQLNKTLENIKNNISEINSKIDKINANNTAKKTDTSKTATTESTKPKTPTTTTTSKTKETPETTKPTDTKKETEKPATTTTSTKNRKILDSLIARLSNATVIEAELEKYEKGLNGEGESNANIKIIASKETQQIKLDVLSSSNKSTSGAKVLYTSGQGDKLKLRPSGALSLITTELDKKDDRILSFNGYTLDDVDFFGMIRRFSDTGYEGEVIGASKAEGVDVYILKITHKTKNTLDPRIKYEHLTFDPKTLNLTSWEAFDGKDTNAFYRIGLKGFTISDTLPANALKI